MRSHWILKSHDILYVLLCIIIIIIIIIIINLHEVALQLLFVFVNIFLLGPFSLLGMRVANVYDIDNKTYLIRLGK